MTGRQVEVERKSEKMIERFQVFPELCAVMLDMCECVANGNAIQPFLGCIQNCGVASEKRGTKK